MKKLIKKYNKKGFTLVELLAAIVILGLLVTAATFAYTTVHEKVLQNQLDNKIEYVEVQAVKWAEELNISGSTIINVQTLVDDGYIQVDEYKDDKPVYSNPVDNTSLLCYTINIEKDGEDYTAKMDMNAGENCELTYDRTTDNGIQVQAFAYDSSKTVSAITNNSGLLDWTNKDVLLVVTSNRYTFNKVSFLPRGGTEIVKEVSNNLLTSAGINQNINPDSYANTIVVAASVILQEEYTIGLYTNDGVKYTTVNVRIDKEPPVIDNIKVGTEWASERTVEIKASDGNGSGLKGIYVSENSTCPTNASVYTTTQDKITKTHTDEKTFYACAIDNTGNITNAQEYKITNLDREGVADNDISLTRSTNAWVRSLTITGKAIDRKSGLVEYGFTNTNRQPITWTKINGAPTNSQVTHTYTVNENGTYYYWVKDLMGNVSSKSIVIDNIDPEAVLPNDISVTKSNDNWVTSLTITGRARDYKSGLVQYAFTTSSYTPSSYEWSRISYGPTNSQISYSYTVTRNGTYYFWVKDQAGNVYSKSINISNIGTVYTERINEYSEYNDYISDRYYLGPNVKEILDVRTNNGYVSYRQSGSYITYTLSGGRSDRYDCSYETYSAPSCTGGYYDTRTGSCIGTYGEVTYAWGEYYTLTCPSTGKWSDWGHDSGDKCPYGYQRFKPSWDRDGVYSCLYNNITGTACTPGTNQSQRCQMYCQYANATPYCSWNQTLTYRGCRTYVPATCYSWSYTITVTYIV